MLTADELLAAVRVHADRVHDAVRRLGCSPEAALEVVETSAHDLVEAEARQSHAVGDPVGWWFARARALGRAAAGGPDVDGELPLGGGVLSTDANQVRLAEALEARPERERAALLLRDSYDLPATAVGTSLGLDDDAAMELVGAARLAFLPALLGGTALSVAGHPVDLGALARLAEGGPLAARDATTRRHVQSCARCADVLDAQERARRLLSGLTVVALPDADREALLASVETRARQLLPAAHLDAFLEDDEEWEDEPHRWYSVSLLALGVVAALGLGVGAGLLLSRGPSSSPVAAVSDLPLVTAAPVINVPVTRPSATALPTVSPTPRVFVLTPSPTPAPTATDQPTATASATETGEPLALQLSPSSGPNDTVITVTGTGWTPGAFVQLVYRERVSGNPGATATVQADADGRFTTTLTAHDSQGLPGPHDVVGGDGTNETTVTFTAT